MKNTLFTALVFICISHLSFAQITAGEYNALMDLYQSTNGANWTNKTGWSTANPNVVQSVQGWYGITTDANGHVTKLILPGNGLSGVLPSSIGDIVFLKELNLNGNQLSGGLPAQIGNLTSLQLLFITQSGLTGSIPSSIGNLTELLSIKLNNNQLSGNLPNSIGLLTKLDNIDLGSNQLSGLLPDEICDLISLRDLRLTSNLFSGPIPSSIGSLSNLEYLFIENNRFSGSIPSSVCSLLKLKQLYLSANLLTGVLPAQIGNLLNLEILHAQGNQLSGSVPESITQLNNLKLLYLNSNQLTGVIPHQIGNLSKLEQLYLRSNQLSGSIPASIGQLQQLVVLEISTNQLTGSIPSSINGLQKLEHFIAHTNLLSGSIPETIGNLELLKQLQLYGNQLTGEIPPSFNSLIELRYLGLQTNQLTGSLPSQLWNLTKLINADFSNNKLSGLIPTNTPSSLTVLNLQHNKFTFSDILPVKANFSGSQFTYIHSSLIDELKTLQAPIGSPYTLTTTIDRNTTPASVYRWYKKVNGVVTPLNEASATGHTVELPAITQADDGIQYYYTITNTAAPGLTLTSHLQTLAATTCQTPVLDFQFEEVNGTHTFNPSVSNADNCTITYSWDFGDGTSSQDQVGNHDYAAVGSYTVVLTITYQCGACASSTLTKEYVVSITNNVLCQSIYCDGNGGVGIGTRKTQGFALSVNGKIRASDIIKVYPHNQWADFVFDKNYKLRPLNEVELFIKRNGHLPEIPSAAQVEKEGVDLGAMDAKLLQKIEELTLYLIAQEKKNNQLLLKLEKQEQEISELKKLVKSKQ